jgi:hypothetical protein
MVVSKGAKWGKQLTQWSSRSQTCCGRYSQRSWVLKIVSRFGTVVKVGWQARQRERAIEVQAVVPERAEWVHQVASRLLLNDTSYTAKGILYIRVDSGERLPRRPCMCLLNRPVSYDPMHTTHKMYTIGTPRFELNQVCTASANVTEASNPPVVCH